MINKLLNIFKEKEKQKILFFCGAGLSQESGLNTFRNANGIWEEHDLEEVCNFHTFKKNKEKVFSFYNARKKQVLKAEPNLAHKKIAEIQKHYGVENVLLFTSNIDNLLTKAGCENVVHVHGDISTMHCLDCEHNWDIGQSEYKLEDTCPECSSSTIKPGIIFFHEPAPKYKDLHKAFELGGPIINDEIVNNIRIVVGTSFKVISADIFKLHRGNSIVLDKSFPDLDGEECSEIIIKPATEGIEDVERLIRKWYSN